MPKHVVDKQLFNFLTLGFVPSLFPEARVVLVTRDTLDVAASQFFTMLADLPFTLSLDGIRRFFQIFDETMGAWRALGVPIYELRYEDLVADPEAQVASLLKWLGLSGGQLEEAVAAGLRRRLLVEHRSIPAAFHDARGPLDASRVNFSRPYLATDRGRALFAPFLLHSWNNPGIILERPARD